MLCPVCNRQINGNDTFCSNCGNRLTAGIPQNNYRSAVPPLQAQQPYQNAYQQPQPAAKTKEPNPVVIFSLTMLIGLVLMAGFMLFIKPGYLLNKDGDSAVSTQKSESRSSSKSEKTTSSRTKKTKREEPAVESEAESSSEAVTTKIPDESSDSEKKSREEKTTTKLSGAERPKETTTTTTAAAETKAPETTTKSAVEEDTERKMAAYAEAMSYDTADRPTFDEFEWCYGQFGLIYTPPEDADMITEPLGFSGGWKCMIIYNPTNYEGTYMREIDNVIISVNGDAVDMTFDWYYMEEPNSEPTYLTDLDDRTFFGDVVGSGISAYNDVTVTVDYFWIEDGREFALGTVNMDDGIPAYLALVRP
ncbi:zinc ribbon domain-containing protein [Ruminococcus sp.]|uniref:zinc ribbon domain-containing protein n=1 Tax=Ruminococcus sp. TaxID=41978 RepID=UPI002600FD71|nr:zinc ribbon domain-containing protein [Ruminococcus sp.]MBQ8965411.1 zinc ribbon domain-containing protein [Ruminococcus sp.]